MCGPHCIWTWSLTQGPIALSSAEAEYYAMVVGASRALSVRAVGREIGFSWGSEPIVLCTDSSSAKSFACRRGLGRQRHVEVRRLWLQQAVADRHFVVQRVAGCKNPADLGTKFLGAEATRQACDRMGVRLEFIGVGQTRIPAEGG